MSVNSYRIKSVSNGMHGHIEVIYKDGCLSLVEFILEMQLSGTQYEWIMKALPQYETKFLQDFDKITKITVQKLLEYDLTTSDKIALFCRLFSLHKEGTKYKVSPKDSGLMKTLSISPELLEWYFKSDHWSIKDRQSIYHLHKQWNEINALFHGKKQAPKGAFPNHYDSDLAKKMEPQQYVKYVHHLRDLGFIPIYKNGSRDIAGFKEPSQAPNQ